VLIGWRTFSVDLRDIDKRDEELSFLPNICLQTSGA
jgi:hypothetical protein